MASIEQVTEFINTIGYVSDSDIPGDNGQVYLSRHDDSYITRVGSEDDNLVAFCFDHGINEVRTDGGKVACIGFSSREGKWYGWSHRAIYGFEVGSSVKKGDCAYVADTPEGLIDDHSNFFADISQESADAHRKECQILDDRSGIRVLHSPVMLPVVSTLDEAIEVINGDESPELVDVAGDYTIVKCGKGAWTARSIEDAKVMACAFAESVS